MFFFKYKAHWDFDGGEVVDNGLIYGESFADAVKLVTKRKKSISENGHMVIA